MKVVVNHISSTGVGEPDTWVDVLVGEITSTPASSEDEATEEELTLTGARTDSPTVLNIKVKVFCDDDFYGDVCGVFCVDTDTCDGHFTCDPATGDKLCSDDYEGPTCQDPKDASAICPSDPFTCQNGGTCITFGDGPEECCCTPGYTGATCEETEDACTDNPCYNGGECVVDGDSFTCNCQPGFYGATCRIFPGQIECTEEPSEEEDIGSYNCTCEEALEPGTCALQEDAPCPENEDCSGTTLPMTTMVTMMTTMLPECNYTDSCEGHYECGIYGEIICLDGWENEDNMCKDRVGYDETTDCIGTQECLNGGTCQEGNLVCCCAEGYQGTFCDEQTQECASNPCVGGTCVELHLGYQCDCEDGSTGESCPFSTVEMTEYTGSTEAVTVQTDGPETSPTAGPAAETSLQGTEAPQTSAAPGSSEAPQTDAVTPEATTEDPLIDLATALLDVLLPDGTDDEREQTLQDIIDLLLGNVGAGAAANRNADPMPTCTDVFSQILVTRETITNEETGQDQTALRLRYAPDATINQAQYQQIVIDCVNSVLAGIGEQLRLVGDEETLLLISKRYSLQLAGSHLDVDNVESIKTAIQTVYQAQYAELQGCQIIIPRLEELVTRNGLLGVQMNYWIQKDENVVSPQLFPEISSLELVTRMNSNNHQLNLKVFSELEQLYNLYTSHPIYVQGTVYRADMENFQEAIANSIGSNDITIEMVPFVDTYIDASTGDEISCIRYHMYNSQGAAVPPTQANSGATNELILRYSMNFVSEAGRPYTLLPDVKPTLDLGSPNTMSSVEYVRKSECLQLIVEDDLFYKHKTALRSALSTSISGEIGATDISLVLHKDVALNRKQYTSVYVAIQASDKILDARRHASKLPTQANILSALEANSVQQADGDAYSVISDPAEVSGAVELDQCLLFYTSDHVNGAIVSGAESELYFGLRAAHPQLLQDQDFDVTAVHVEDFINPETGENRQGVYLAVSMTSPSGTQALNVQTMPTLYMDESISIGGYVTLHRDGQGGVSAAKLGSVFFEGLVPYNIMDDIINGLQEINQLASDFTMVYAGVWFERLTDDGMTITEIIYSLKKTSDNSLLDARTVANHLPSHMAVINIPTQSTSHIIYGEESVRYDHLFHVNVAGELDGQQVQQLKQNIKTSWFPDASDEVTVEVLKEELGFGKLGNEVTIITFSVLKQGEVVSPLYFMKPSIATLSVEGIGNGVVVQQQQVSRSSFASSIAIKGELSYAHMAQISTQLQEMYATLLSSGGYTSIEVDVIGAMAAVVTADVSVHAQKIFYTLTTDGTTRVPVGLPDLNTGTLSQFLQSISGTEVIGQTEIITLRGVTLSSVYTEDNLVTVTQDIKQAWEDSANANVDVSLVDVVYHVTEQWLPATRLWYAADTAQWDVTVSPGANLDIYYTGASSASRPLYLYPSSGLTETQLASHIQTIYQSQNHDVSVVINTDIVLSATNRQKRSAENLRSQQFYDDNNEPVAVGYLATSYQGAELNPLFYVIPADTHLYQRLEALGYRPCTACRHPQMCTEIYVQGLVGDATSRDLLSGVTDAYVTTNSGLQRNDVNVTITELQPYLTANGDEATAVRYCVTTPTHRDVVIYIQTPDEATMSAAIHPIVLSEDSLREEEQQADNNDGSNSTKIIIIIVVILVVVAIAVVALVILKICCRHSDSDSTVSKSAIHDYQYHDEDESSDFAGHAPYQSSVFRTNELDTVYKNKIMT